MDNDDLDKGRFSSQSARVEDIDGNRLSSCALKKAIALLERGEATLICPEPLSIRLLRPSGPLVPSKHGGLNTNQQHKNRIIGRLRARDGRQCFYCGQGLSRETVTVEHLLNRAHGGSDHQSNLVLACSPCNAMAADKSIAEKVRLREQLRESR